MFKLVSETEHAVGMVDALMVHYFDGRCNNCVSSNSLPTQTICVHMFGKLIVCYSKLHFSQILFIFNSHLLKFALTSLIRIIALFHFPKRFRTNVIQIHSIKVISLCLCTI